jgi:V/A-type H+-transporting ATPase subunit A
LDEKLAYSRHYPAINWLNSYSLYTDQLSNFYRSNAGDEWDGLRQKAMTILQEEDSLEEVVRLVGVEALSKEEQLLLYAAKMVREDYLQQNAYDDVDTYTSLKKQYRILKSIMLFYETGRERLSKSDAEITDLTGLSVVTDIARAKMIKEEELEDKFNELDKNIVSAISEVDQK